MDCLQQVKDDDRIGEIVISDDCSTDGSYAKLQEHFKDDKKVKLFRNEKNCDCHFNKAHAVRRATNKWVILFDDDNIIGRDYLDVLFEKAVWYPDVVYCPDFAKPHFNYTAFAGVSISKTNVYPFAIRKHFFTALNTCNYFVRRDAYLEVWDGTLNPHTADSLYQIYRWLSSGRRIFITPGLRYFHRVHAGSHYQNNHKKTGSFSRQVEEKIKALR